MEFFNFFGISNYIHIIKSKIKEVIENASPVLINGPIGTGKKTIAKIIVNHYPHRLNDNYYYINLLDIAESKETILRNICRPNFMVKQNTNMVMMDHCEALDFSLQKYFISNKNNNIKYIFITNKKIEENNFQQYFKEEFYQLIRVNHLVTKSLKEHKEDIPFLIQYFLNQYNEKYKKEITEVEKDALSFLLSYNYPENILELERIIEKIVMIADDPIIKLDLLNQFIRDHEDMKVMILNPSLKYKQALKLADSKVDRYYFNMALKLTNYNKTKAAKLLNISLRQFQYKCRELGL